MNPLQAISETFKTLMQRSANPIIGSFISSWLVINWKLLLLLLKSNSEIEATISIIENEHLKVEHILYYPLIFSISYVIFAPWLSVVISVITSKAEVISANIIYNKSAYINQAEKSAMLADPKLKLPYESIESVLATIFIHMSDEEKRKIITCLRSQLPETKKQK